MLRRSASMRLMARRGTAQLCFGCGGMPACLELSGDRGNGPPDTAQVRGTARQHRQSQSSAGAAPSRPGDGPGDCVGHQGELSAMSASGKYGPVDLCLGSRAKSVLERHIAVSDGRVRGIRNPYGN
jgi:hypothetical protein